MQTRNALGMLLDAKILRYIAIRINKDPFLFCNNWVVTCVLPHFLHLLEYIFIKTTIKFHYYL